MIEKLDKTYNFTFDFMQDSVNQKIIDKVNEIIDYINKNESKVAEDK